MGQEGQEADGAAGGADAGVLRRYPQSILAGALGRTQTVDARLGGCDRSLPAPEVDTRKRTMTAVLTQITARFAREYLAATGRSVGFRLSFGGSGTQARRNHCRRVVIERYSSL